MPTGSPGQPPAAVQRPMHLCVVRPTVPSLAGHRGLLLDPLPHGRLARGEEGAIRCRVKVNGASITKPSGHGRSSPAIPSVPPVGPPWT